MPAAAQTPIGVGDADAPVHALAVQADGKLLVGGAFTTVGGASHNRLARLNADGTVDNTFTPDVTGLAVYALAVQPDRRIVVAGDFSAIGGIERQGVARLEADGSLDPAFNPGANGAVRAVIVQPDATIVVGGDFTTIGGGGTGSTALDRIARLTAAGAVDPAFHSGADASVLALLRQGDGKLIVGGSFASLANGAAPIARAGLARLNTDGSVETGFNPGANGAVATLAIQFNGRILVGGRGISTIGGASRHGLARLLPDGSVDPFFNPGTDGDVEVIALQENGGMLVAGSFTILSGGTSGITRQNIGRLDSAGNLDLTFNPGADQRVRALVMEADGRINVGGDFTGVGGGTGTVTAAHLGRLTNTGPAAQTVSLFTGRSPLMWARSGTLPQPERVTFEYSLDGQVFTFLGDATPSGTSWALGVSLPDGSGIVRARAFYGAAHSITEVLQIVQAVGCVSTLPAGNILVPASANVFFSVTTAAAFGCSFTAASNTSWINSVSVRSGVSPGTQQIFFRVETNPVPGIPRTGSLTINERVYFVIQAAAPPVRRAVSSDLDGDGIPELAVWRPSTGMWFWLTSSTGYDPAESGQRQWGNAALGDVSKLGDVDGDGLPDLIEWRPSTGSFYSLLSSAGYITGRQTERKGRAASVGDIPLVGDIDGDSLADFIVWRAATGTWEWYTSSTGYSDAGLTLKQWGNASLGDVPVPADVDGDGKLDLVLWRASTGTWFWLTSSTGYDYAKAGSVQWGNQGLGDVPLVGDLDGDGRADLAVWRASTGTWFWLSARTGYNQGSFGIKQWGNAAAGDQPLLADLDGDGVDDLVVWRASTGTWFWLTSSSGYAYDSSQARQWGAPTDRPVLVR